MSGLFVIGSFTYELYAQQTGNYKSVDVESQTRGRDSDGKVVIADYKPFETRLIDNFKDYQPKDVKLGRYGGDLTRSTKATGFFYTHNDNGRWFIVDPDGYYNFHIAVNSINTGKSARNKKAFAEKFSSKENWIGKTTALLIQNGFNGSGSWSDTEAIVAANTRAKKPLVYTINLNFMGSYGDKRGGTYQVPGHKAYPKNTIFVFDPKFEAHCEDEAKKLLRYKGDPNLLGYFSDNEMPLHLQYLEGYLSMEDKKDPGYLAATKWIAEKGINKEQITDAHREEFLALAASRYFSIVRKAIKKYDPNHLYLGCRFYASEKNIARFMETAGKYLDIVSINYYGVWTPNKQQLHNWGKWTKKPFIVTEFYTKGEDSGLGNTSGAGWIVRTQADRGKAYQNFCLGLLESKNCVGWHWFKYQDNDPTLVGAEPSNVDANKGIVDNHYQVYTPLLKLMKQLNEQRYQLINYFDKVNELKK
ncbi:hypothetical protein [Pedobacter insulae]|nr:hypothetical protein [Pedobacter insulae]